ncbi:MAG: L,D-transpeptidase family protein [Vicinamibacterales bacterium]
MRIILVIVMAAFVAAQPAVGQTGGNGLVGSAFEYTVQAGDSLRRLAARFGVPVQTLATMNGRGVRDVLHPGDRLVVDNRHIVPGDPAVPLLLNIPQRLLYLRSGTEVRVYPMAVGTSGWPTPAGAFHIVDKEERPTWDVPVSIQEEMRQQGRPVLTRVAPGPENPLGAYFIRLSFSGIGIHGTNAPASIYQFATHGCVRLSPADIADLYPRVEIDMRGLAIYEPVLMTVSDGRIWLEVHPDVYRRAPAALKTVTAIASALGVRERMDWTLAADAVRRPAGIAVDVTR